ncbi:MAG TPA: hypothetical protein RMH85_10390 [Polyangiaceae bacterium LLY-WYZ-15_(1-7)]|nr:hypothetical protein [Sandaracinus sp.]HJL00152.1 hypothetical protein [Polyangiaceae bacterium LLY-WYZ-15_(1-7)]MBJ74701.1 hypothetical protein [Sandaracinus sp.]HJL08900.1 hypothetical protein [Polyangiaceae bacterium LLY-WYZ-15_(1-7)]HJL27346.1 hypothetical protein [Polyangiaceae bacterium LLY-WYZ-15_(1-7)]
MAKRKKRDPGKPVLRRRGSGEPRKGLDPELEALARGDEDVYRPRRKRGPRLRDPRPVALVPGVANRDARSVLDARVARMREAREDDAELGRLLAEALWLGLWRGRSLIDFDALAEEVLEVPADRAQALAKAACAAAELPMDTLSDEAVAIWMRAEAALLDAGFEGRVSAVDPKTLRFELAVPVAPQALAAMGRRMTPLVRDREGGGGGGGRRPPRREGGAGGDRRPPRREGGPKGGGKKGR